MMRAFTWIRRQLQPAPPAPQAAAKRPYEHLSDADVQQKAISVAFEREAAITEALFRTRDALLESQGKTEELTRRIETLTSWLVWLTIGIFALTVVLTLVGLGILKTLS